jgi:putative Mg2+ transporter-C (MgtC) family protein
MACGAGVPILALFATALHFVVVFTFPHIMERLPKSRFTPSPLQVTYEDGRGILRDVLVACTQHDFAVSGLRVERESALGDRRDADGSVEGGAAATRTVTVTLEIQGIRSVAKLAAKLAEISGVVAVKAGDVNVASD